MASYTLEQLAKCINAECNGDPKELITAIAPLNKAQKGQISFLHNKLYCKYLLETQASAVILTPDFSEQCPVNSLVVTNPYSAFAKIASLFETVQKAQLGIHPSAIVGNNCDIHASASIGPHCTLGDNVTISADVVVGANCVIGDGAQIAKASRIWPYVSIYQNVIIGERARIHSGVVLGSDGFGLVKEEGVWHRVPQLGGLVIGNDVDIGSNTTIDRGALENTVIADGVKLDNLIQIGHNVQIGEHTAIAACTGVSGSTKIGAHCIIAGGVCIAGHLEIVDNVTITGMAGVSHSIHKEDIYSGGVSLRPNHIWRKNAARFNQLDTIARRLKMLETKFQTHTSNGEDKDGKN